MPPHPSAQMLPLSTNAPYQQIAREIREAILAGQLKPGEQLPTISELATRYGVSAGTAHRAMATVRAEGLVSASRGRRATVNSYTQESPHYRSSSSLLRQDE
ncbi:winged helix-turn-helix domain-containing protein [Micromonospora sagamiensis]|uniref:winged helix-turn-helix domain-containing protein n=2 Tax=Micromonospora sagamiensis TaxID=47875 RepID=UPI003144E122